MQIKQLFTVGLVNVGLLRHLRRPKLAPGLTVDRLVPQQAAPELLAALDFGVFGAQPVEKQRGFRGVVGAVKNIPG